jgi:3-(3-hydroxy-phenyl)propionate hydroxylase
MTGRTQVLVVGAGPTGLTVAHLLRSYGVEVLVVERSRSTTDQPRAVSLDDEALRVLQCAGLADAVYDTIVPGTGTRYYDARNRFLVHARGMPGEPFGHPVKNPFDQTEFDALLASLLAGGSEGPAIRFGTELVGLARGDQTVVATLSGPGGAPDVIEADFLLGCDGGRSTVRDLIGARMVGRTFAEPWLVVDTTGDQHSQRYGMHFADPLRPRVVIPGRAGRCRYEFMVMPGEDLDELTRPRRVVELVSRYRRIEESQIRRARVYVFHALVADRWRAGRVFLLGDAAHMMPPFAGQGLNTGLRDAGNLAWKLDAVLRGLAGDLLLDSYERERRPNAEATIAMSVRLGRFLMTTSPARARARDALARTLLRFGPARRYITEMRYKPVARYERGLTLSPVPDRKQVRWRRTRGRAGRGAASLVGHPLPQPRVLGADLRPVLLDEVLGPRFALVGVDVADSAWELFGHPYWGLLAPRRVDLYLDDRLPVPRPGRTGAGDADGRLSAALHRARGRFLLVRPDRYVAAVFHPEFAGQTADRLIELAGAARPLPAQPVQAT